MNKCKLTTFNIAALVLMARPSYADRTYMCKPCPIGTYNDGSKYECEPCPADHVCPLGTGTPIPVANCKSKQIEHITKAGAGTTDLIEGIYKIEVAGGGGGGSGGSLWKKGVKKYWHCGHYGGRGGTASGIVHIPTLMTVPYFVGSGGYGGPGDCDNYCNAGGKGGDTRFTVESSNFSILGCGGNGGYAHKYGLEGSAAACGNGQGAGGGAGDCRSYSGHVGATGWINIYQLYDCKLTPEESSETSSD